ncbi:MAG TPA: Ppx/GppA phosphatase family protein [Streptosporangiaceae bacterium]|nr:Ppx/GppA phosphatase family protein [Streptosporangiaceae bacterium]
MIADDWPGETMAAAGPSPRRVAAIDCGTNSIRLLIADVSPERGELSDVTRRMEIVRLGQGVDATGRLAPDALARTLGVLERYARAIADAGATATRMVATSATRDASNAAEFRAGVVAILGIEPEVISGAQEARLSFTGATAELAGAGPVAGMEPPYLVVDIGGGSTEFVVGTGAGAGVGSGAWSGVRVGAGAGGLTAAGGAGQLRAISTDIGCVRLTERHLRADPPTGSQIAAATADIDAAIGTAAAAVLSGTGPAAPRTLVGLAGSVTTVAAIALGLPGYDPGRIHHARITAGQVHEVAQRLLGQTRAQRAAIGPMHPGRVDVIGAGALILDRILTRLGFAEVVASEHDILDGIAWSLADA